MLTTKQAAERLKITVRAVQLLIKRERLPAQKIGRDWMIEEKDLKNFKHLKPGGYQHSHK